MGISYSDRELCSDLAGGFIPPVLKEPVKTAAYAARPAFDGKVNDLLTLNFYDRLPPFGWYGQT